VDGGASMKPPSFFTCRRRNPLPHFRRQPRTSAYLKLKTCSPLLLVVGRLYRGVLPEMTLDPLSSPPHLPAPEFQAPSPPSVTRNF
jgi:hypothetical protein